MFWAGYCVSVYISWGISLQFVLVLIILAGVCAQRVVSGYHTPDQVLYGVIFGGFLAVAWDFLMQFTNYGLIKPLLEVYYKALADMFSETKDEEIVPKEPEHAQLPEEQLFM